jgi:hypothetical protein
MKTKIGINAGIVWETLSKTGITEIKALKKATKLTDKDLYAAIGWLAREDKVVLEENGADVNVGLA